MLESLFNKVAGLNVCNSIKKRLQHSCFSVKFANFLRAASVVTSEVWVMFSKESEQKTGATVSSKYHIQQEKCICCQKSSEAATLGVL